MYQERNEIAREEYLQYTISKLSSQYVHSTRGEERQQGLGRGGEGEGEGDVQGVSSGGEAEQTDNISHLRVPQ